MSRKCPMVPSHSARLGSTITTQSWVTKGIPRVTAHTLGPDQQVQLAYIAQRHFVQGRTRIEIAEETGLSRFKVGRLLEEAIEHGIVKFEIASPPGINLALSVELQKHYGLQHSLVVEVATEEPGDIQDRLGQAGARLLEEILTEDDVLGLTSGRTIGALARALQELPHCDVVQLAGVAGAIQETGIEVMRRVSSVARVQPWAVYSPLVVSDAESARAILRQHDTKRTFEQYRRVSVAVVAVGSWKPEDSQMIHNPALTTADRDQLLAAGARAEIGATLIAADGTIITDLDDRTIAISEPELRRVPTVIALAGGARKTSAIHAVLRSGLVNSLVTDTATAHRLLALPREA